MALLRASIDADPVLVDDSVIDRCGHEPWRRLERRGSRRGQSTCQGMDIRMVANESGVREVRKLHGRYQSGEFPRRWHSLRIQVLSNADVVAWSIDLREV